MFATYKTPEELQNYFSNFSGSEHFTIMLGAMLMQNHIANNFNLIEKKESKKIKAVWHRDNYLIYLNN